MLGVIIDIHSEVYLLWKVIVYFAKERSHLPKQEHIISKGV